MDRPKSNILKLWKKKKSKSLMRKDCSTRKSNLRLQIDQLEKFSKTLNSDSCCSDNGLYSTVSSILTMCALK